MNSEQLSMLIYCYKTVIYDYYANWNKSGLIFF